LVSPYFTGFVKLLASYGSFFPIWRQLPVESCPPPVAVFLNSPELLFLPQPGNGVPSPRSNTAFLLAAVFLRSQNKRVLLPFPLKEHGKNLLASSWPTEGVACTRRRQVGLSRNLAGSPVACVFLQPLSARFFWAKHHGPGRSLSSLPFPFGECLYPFYWKESPSF